MIKFALAGTCLIIAAAVIWSLVFPAAQEDDVPEFGASTIEVETPVDEPKALNTRTRRKTANAEERAAEVTADAGGVEATTDEASALDVEPQATIQNTETPLSEASVEAEEPLAQAPADDLASDEAAERAAEDEAVAEEVAAQAAESEAVDENIRAPVTEIETVAKEDVIRPAEEEPVEGDDAEVAESIEGAGTEMEGAIEEASAEVGEVDTLAEEAVAQDVEVTSAEVETQTEFAEDVQEYVPIASPAIAAEKKGDVVILTSGIRLTDVQVVRATALVYEIEIMEGVEPMIIPRKQVASVEYDEYEPLRERRRRELFPQRAELSEIMGEKIAPELLDKLTAKLVKRNITIEREDIIKTLERMGKRVGVEIMIDDSVRALRTKSRLWDVQITEMTTLIELIQEHLLKTFDDLKVEFDYDRVILITREAAAAKLN